MIENTMIPSSFSFFWTRLKMTACAISLTPKTAATKGQRKVLEIRIIKDV
jgi:hypothetical protein